MMILTMIPHVSDLCCPIAKAVASTDVNCRISGIRIQRNSRPSSLVVVDVVNAAIAQQLVRLLLLQLVVIVG